jgi:hypothetical protein
MYSNVTLQTSSVYLALFANNIYMCMPWIANMIMISDSCSAVSIQLRRGESAGTLESMKMKTQAVYFSHRLRPPEVHLTLNEQNIPSANHAKYLSVIIDKRITWRFHIEVIPIQK